MNEAIKVTLTTPVQLKTGRTITELSIREPKVKDMLAAQKQAKGDSAESEIRLIANLAEVTPEDVQELSIRDYNSVQEVLKSFTGSQE